MRFACIASALFSFLFTFAQPARSGEDAAMTFRMTPDTEQERFIRRVVGGRIKIYAKGTITEGTHLKFLEFLKQNNVNEAVTLYFNSPGGSLVEGITLGRVIRTLGYSTGIGEFGKEYNFKDTQKEIRAICASACVYAFAGGVLREYLYQDTLLGVHQFYRSEKENIGDIGDTQKLSAMILAYLTEMGVNSRAFVIASLATKDDMIWITPSEAAALNLAHNGSEKTTAQIKLADGTPYLRLEQIRETATARILFLCDRGVILVRAGIVTTEDNTQELLSWNHAYYIELSDQSRLRGRSIIPAQSTMWVDIEPITPLDRLAILKSDILDVWLESGGPVRRGAQMDITPVKAEIQDFFSNCHQ
ncbi:hypothetical protein [Pseudomonas sp. GL-RE-20]|uniref:COG3904 family protein n=1 Tax=Pseudomonas sp. GL-RE-20 TaxID=2832372 RepID=UPI001CC1A7B2|nr:hypothetical protein [Pseudomonas sp. GL-RE-20]